MNSTVWVGIGTVAGAGLTAVATYFIARRKASGTVDTSEADSLWREASRLRDALRDEVAALRQSLMASQAEEDRLRQALYAANMKTGELTLRVAALEQRLERYEAKK